MESSISVLIPYLNGKFPPTALAGNLVSAGMIINDLHRNANWLSRRLKQEIPFLH